MPMSGRVQAVSAFSRIEINKHTKLAGYVGIRAE